MRHVYAVFYLLEVIDNITVHRRPEFTELADVGHLACIVVYSHVSQQSMTRLVISLTDTTHQYVHIVHVDLKIETEVKQCPIL